MTLKTPKPTREEREAMTRDELLRAVWLLDDVIESMRWIPISERLPEEEYLKEEKHRGKNAVFPVLATIRKKKRFANTYTTVDRAFFGKKNNKYVFCNIDVQELDVIAWMKLPEVYT